MNKVNITYKKNREELVHKSILKFFDHVDFKFKIRDNSSVIITTREVKKGEVIYTDRLFFRDHKKRNYKMIKRVNYSPKLGELTCLK